MRGSREGKREGYGKNNNVATISVPVRSARARSVHPIMQLYKLRSVCPTIISRRRRLDPDAGKSVEILRKSR